MVTPDTYSAASGRAIIQGQMPRWPTQDCVVAGDSITQFGTGFVWGFPACGSPFRLVNNAGVSGDTLENLLARWQATVLDKLPNGGCIFLRIGTNSLGKSQSAFMALYQQFVDSVVANPSLKMVMHAIPVKAGAGAIAKALNVQIKALADQLPERLRYTDDCAAMGDAGYEPLPGMLLDGVHMAPLGSYTSGIAMAADIKKWVRYTDPRVVLSSDSYTVNPASKQYVKNPTLAGTTGTVSQGITGQAATGLSVYGYGGGVTGTAAIVPADVGDGVHVPWQRVTLTGATGVGYLYITADMQHPAIPQTDTTNALDLVYEFRLNSLDTASLGSLSSFVLSSNNYCVPASGIGMAGAGVLSGTFIGRNSYKRGAFDIPANTMKLYLELGVKQAFSGSIGSIDVRCISTTGHQ